MALYPEASSPPDGNLRRPQAADPRPTGTNQRPRTSAHGMLARAEAILALHREDPDGWCGGCLRDAILVFHPCERVTWATRVATDHRHARAQTPAGRV